MSVKSDLLKNTQNSFQLFSNKKILQKGGKSCCGKIGNSVTMTSLNDAANSGMGYSRAVGVPYKHVGGGGYAFDNKSASLASTFKGSYPAYSTYQKPSQCGGRKRRKRTRRRKSSKKSHRYYRKKKSHSKKRKSRKYKKGGKKRKSRKHKKGGKKRKSRRKRRNRSLSTLGSPQIGGSTVSYSLGASNAQNPWSLANNSYSLNEKSCFDNYNHFKKN